MGSDKFKNSPLRRLTAMVSPAVNNDSIPPEEKTSPTAASRDLDSTLGLLMAATVELDGKLKGLDSKIDIIRNEITLHFQDDKIGRHKLAARSSNRSVALVTALWVLWEAAGPVVKQVLNIH